MRGFVNLELQIFIPYLILPEVLRTGVKAQQKRAEQAKKYNDVFFYFGKMFIHMVINRISAKISEKVDGS